MYDENRSFPQKRKRDIRLPIMLTLADLTCVVLGLLAAYGVRFHSPLAGLLTPGHVASDYMFLLPLAVLAWMGGFYFAHLYRRNEKIWSWLVAGRLTKGALLAVALFVTVLFFLRPDAIVNPVARGMIPLSMAMVGGGVGLLRWGLHRWVVVRARRHGRGLARALVLGVGPSAKEVGRALRRHPEYGWRVAGFLSDDAGDVGLQQTGFEVIGSVEDLGGAIEREGIEAVFVAKPDFRHERLGDVFIECQKRMVDVKVMPDLTEMLFTHVDFEEVGNIPFLGIRESPLRGWHVVLKRLFDLALGSFFFLCAAPLMGVVAILIKRDSEGPVFYRQKRVGADGNFFFITKFRTMRVDAEKVSGPVFSGPDDPRQTRIGRKLRQLHLDELPQLLNVLAGDMSLVGPRPERPHFVDQFREEIPRYMVRHRIKSGMTGWAQVSGQTGYEGTIADRLRYDLYYIENWSSFFDLKVLVLTVVWLFRRSRQLATLSPDHPSLRRFEAADVPEEEPEGDADPVGK